MVDLPILLPVQKALLIDLIEAAERVPMDRRTHFLVHSWRGDNTEVTAIAHPGLDKEYTVFFGDLEVLAYRGLVLLREMLHETHQITLLPEAYILYGTIKDPAAPAAFAVVRQVLVDTLERAQRARRVLERTSAAYGSINIPSQVVIELEDKKVQIKEIKKRLKELDQINAKETT